MSTRRQKLVLPLPPGEVEGLAADVVSKLGWTVEWLGPGRAVVHEDPARLHCHCAPLAAQLRFKPTDAGATEIMIEGQVPGWGPVASKHSREQTDLLTRRIGLRSMKSPAVKD